MELRRPGRGKTTDVRDDDDAEATIGRRAGAEAEAEEG